MDTYKAAWRRMEKAVGRPPNAKMRMEGLYDEISYLNDAEFEYAVERFLDGEGGAGAGTRMPYPKEIKALARSRVIKRVSEVPRQFPALEDMPDSAIESYLSSLEDIHRREVLPYKTPEGGIPFMRKVVQSLLRHAYAGGKRAIKNKAIERKRRDERRRFEGDGVSPVQGGGTHEKASGGAPSTE